MRVSIERFELKDVVRKTLSIAEKHKFPAILLRKYSISPAPTKNIMLNIGTYRRLRIIVVVVEVV